MGAAVERLTGLVNAQDRFDIPYAQLLPMQIAAANERFADRIGAIKLLGNRADTAGITAVRDAADLVPLLFAHTSYKSYPEGWFTQGKWDRMGQWLDTITTYRVRDVDTKDVPDVDEWLNRLGAAGHYISCSSGTTGKCSMIPSSMADRKFVQDNMVANFSWATGIAPQRKYHHFGLSPVAVSFRNNDCRLCMLDAFSISERLFPGEPITVGQISKMVALRRSVADGTARPGDIVAYEETVAKREKAMEYALTGTAEALVAARAEPILFMGMYATMYKISELVRNMGYSAKDFHPENAMLVGGGLKGATLPVDYRERIMEVFNLRPEKSFQFYGMQELNTIMPRCNAGRYHLPPWLMLLLLDQSGDQLIRPTKGETEGRAAFFDLSLDGRWCGIISGDKIKVDYGVCACGHQGPTVNPDIVRYSDLPGGDKISCAGTIDAYIRGAA